MYIYVFFENLGANYNVHVFHLYSKFINIDTQKSVSSIARAFFFAILVAEILGKKMLFLHLSSQPNHFCVIWENRYYFAIFAHQTNKEPK